MLLPITRTPPASDSSGIEVRMRVERALGLDETSGWVILSEHNVDEWSNAGLSKPSGQRDVYSYGFVPPGLFSRINAHFLELARSKMSRAVRR